MSVYTAITGTITPALATDNWTLSAGANGATTTNSGRIVSVHWSGEVTTSTAMETEVKRPTTASTGAATNITAGRTHPNAIASGSGLLNAAISWATTDPTIPGVGVGVLIGSSWNAHGGIFYWHAGNFDEEFACIGGLLTGQISCRNFTGTGASNYGLGWRED